MAGAAPPELELKPSFKSTQSPASGPGSDGDVETSQHPSGRASERETR